MSFIAIKDMYAKSGKAEELLKKHGLTAPDIENAVRSLIPRKRSSS
jgi:transketolase C-terminal domain/subunit